MYNIISLYPNLFVHLIYNLQYIWHKRHFMIGGIGTYFTFVCVNFSHRVGAECSWHSEVSKCFFFFNCNTSTK